MFKILKCYLEIRMVEFSLEDTEVHYAWISTINFNSKINVYKIHMLQFDGLYKVVRCK